MTRTPASTIVRRRLTRRDLFKAAPIAGAGAATLALGLHVRAPKLVTARGVCRFCLFHCGIEVTTQGKDIVRVQGDLASRTRGFLCQHGYALKDIVHHAERVRAPLVRKNGELHEVSWAEALGVVAQRLERVKQRFGAEAFAVQTGWPLVRHPLTALLHRFCRAFGTPNLASVASLCEASLRMGQALVTGSKYQHDVSRAKTLVLWGANPERAAPLSLSSLLHCAEEKRLIVVDPTRTPLAKLAVEHLQPRPGSDGALALGLMHVLIAEKLYDRAFVEAHVTGFDALAKYVEQFPPERTAQLTTVSVEQLLRTARHLGTHGPVHVWSGLGIEQHECGVQTVRATVALEALTGAFDETWEKSQRTPPGPRFGDEPLPTLYRMATPRPVPPEPRARAIGYDAYPLFEVFNREAQANLFARAMLHDEPYPLRALMLIGANPFVTAPESNELRRGAEKLELLVCVDPFLSASARLADVVLPASTFAEAPTVDEELRGPRRNDDADTSVAQTGVVPVQHDTLPDWKIVFELARAMGLGHYFPWASFKEAMDAPHEPYMLDPAHQPRPDVASAARFGTLSGKIELKSTLLERFGYAGLPEWTPPAESLDGAFPLLLVSGPREQVFINSQFRNVASLRKKVPEPRARVHPSLGIADGTRVAIITEQGRVEMRVTVDEAVHRESVVAPSGWAEANVNAVTSARRLDPISGFPAMRSTRCRLEVLAAAPWPVE